MPAPFFPNTDCFNQAAARRTALALSVVKLFKSGFAPNVNVTDTDLDAHEADFDDYVAQTITAWGAPVNSVYGGAQITAPTVQFTCTGAQVTPNTIGGYWIETAGGAVVMVRQFDDPVPMVADHDGITINATIVVPNGQ